MAANTYAKKGLGSVGSYFGWGKKKEPVEVEAPIEYVEEPQADGDTEAKVDLIEQPSEESKEIVEEVQEAQKQEIEVVEEEIVKSVEEPVE